VTGADASDAARASQPCPPGGRRGGRFRRTGALLRRFCGTAAGRHWPAPLGCGGWSSPAVGQTAPIHARPRADNPDLRDPGGLQRHSWRRSERRLGARSLGYAPSLSVMSYIDLARAERRSVQRTGLGDRRRTGMPSILRDERSAEAGQIPPDL